MRSAVALLLALLSLQFGGAPLTLTRCLITGEVKLSCCCDSDGRSAADGCCDRMLVKTLRPDATPAQARLHLAPPLAPAHLALASSIALPSGERASCAPAPHPRPPPSVPRYLVLRSLLV